MEFSSSKHFKTADIYILTGVMLTAKFSNTRDSFTLTWVNCKIFQHQGQFCINMDHTNCQIFQHQGKFCVNMGQTNCKVFQHQGQFCINMGHTNCKIFQHQGKFCIKMGHTNCKIFQHQGKFCINMGHINCKIFQHQGQFLVWDYITVHSFDKVLKQAFPSQLKIVLSSLNETVLSKNVTTNVCFPHLFLLPLSLFRCKAASFVFTFGSHILPHSLVNRLMCVNTSDLIWIP